jgi:hypothetical protein
MKTAVQYLIEKLETPKWQDSLGKELTMAIHEDIKAQALEMEEKQIKDAWLSAWKDSMLTPLSNECYQELADEYYKQKYKQ